MNDSSIVYNKNIKDKIKSQQLLNGVYLVSTPIGNILDITIRAIEILNNSDIILAEDTRITLNLLKFYAINDKKLISFNDITENRNLEKYINLIKNNNIVSIVSDAGTPLISDPGFKLIRELIKEDIQLFSIPGPNAAISALTLSGLPTNTFYFQGFLSNKKGKKISELENLKNIQSTIIIYESPFKLLNTLNAIKEVFGDNKHISISREITKKFEQNTRGEVGQVLENLNDKNIKGEFVIVIDNKN